MIWAALKMTLALGLVIAALAFLSRFSGKWKGRPGLGGFDGGIRVLTSKLIGPQKYVSLVEIGGEVLALGITAQQITFLTKIENKEWLSQRASEPQLKTEPLPWLRGISPFRRKGTGNPGGEP